MTEFTPRWLAALGVALPLTLSSSVLAAAPLECIAANERAIELRKAGRFREAHAQLLLCAAEGCPAEVRAECGGAIVDVMAAIPTLVLAAQDHAGNDIVAVKVTMDGRPLTERLDGSAIELDPGPHEFVFQAAAGVEKRTIVLREGEKDRRETIRFAAPTTPPTLVRDPTRRTLGLVTGTVGVVGLGVGIVAGVLATVTWSSAQRECTDPASASCLLQGHQDSLTAQTMAYVANAAFIGGGALVVLGGVLFFTAPYVTPGKVTSGGLVLGARF